MQNRGAVTTGWWIQPERVLRRIGFRKEVGAFELRLAAVVRNAYGFPLSSA
ncbi:MAG: hypothetical protein ACR2H4_14435 [Pyrinomonadaceae bacterium]